MKLPLHGQKESSLLTSSSRTVFPNSEKDDVQLNLLPNFPKGIDAGSDDTVVEPEIVTVLEHWLRKVEDEAAKIFRQKSENRTDFKTEMRSDIRAFPSVGQDVAAARSKPEPWEKFEDRRPARMRTMDFSSMSDIKLSCSSSQDLLEDRMRIQFMRWSQTRVYRVTSDMRKDAMQERLDKVRNSVSRVMFQAGSDSEYSPSDTDLHVSISTI